MGLRRWAVTSGSQMLGSCQVPVPADACSALQCAPKLPRRFSAALRVLRLPRQVASLGACSALSAQVLSEGGAWECLLVEELPSFMRRLWSLVQESAGSSEPESPMQRLRSRSVWWSMVQVQLFAEMVSLVPGILPAQRAFKDF